jgi:hypothetical protein
VHTVLYDRLYTEMSQVCFDIEDKSNSGATHFILRIIVVTSLPRPILDRFESADEHRDLLRLLKEVLDKENELTIIQLRMEVAGKLTRLLNMRTSTSLRQQPCFGWCANVGHEKRWHFVAAAVSYCV